MESSPLKPEIDREIAVESQETAVVEDKAEKMTKIEIRTVEDIAKALDEMQRILETHQNNLPREERERIAGILTRISKEEDMFKRNIQNLHRLFQSLDVVDAKNFKELQDRLAKASGKERKLIQVEMEEEEGKLKIEKAIFELDRRLAQALGAFNQYIMAAMNHIRGSPYPYDATPQISQAGAVLKSILAIIKETETLEEKLVTLGKAEKKLLKKERDVA